MWNDKKYSVIIIVQQYATHILIIMSTWAKHETTQKHMNKKINEHFIPIICNIKYPPNKRQHGDSYC